MVLNKAETALSGQQNVELNDKCCGQAPRLQDHQRAGGDAKAVLAADILKKPIVVQKKQ